MGADGARAPTFVCGRRNHDFSSKRPNFWNGQHQYYLGVRPEVKSRVTGQTRNFCFGFRVRKRVRAKNRRETPTAPLLVDAGSVSTEAERKAKSMKATRWQRVARLFTVLSLKFMMKQGRVILRLQPPILR